MKSFFFLFTLIPALVFSGTYSDEEKASLLTSSMFAKPKRHTLKITNNTHLDEGEDGRYLYLVWNRDVHEPPQTTEALSFGATASRESRGIGNGNNSRHFDIEVHREFFGDREYVGSFTHTIYADAFENGHTEETWIFKKTTADSVELWREYYNRKEDPPQLVRDFIGSIPIEDWEG